VLRARRDLLLLALDGTLNYLLPTWAFADLQDSDKCLLALLLDGQDRCPFSKEHSDHHRASPTQARV